MDASFVGHLGDAELAAITFAQVWLAILMAPTWGIATALNTLCSQAYGAKNMRLVGTWLQVLLPYFPGPACAWIFLVGLLVGLLLTALVAVGIFFTEPVIRLFLGHACEQDGRPCMLAGRWARYTAIQLVPVTVYMAVRAYFQAFEVTKPAMVVSVLSVGVNFGLNWVLVKGVGSWWSGLGFIGSPIATAVSLCWQLGVFSLYVFWWRKLHRDTWFGWSSECLEPSKWRVFLAQALPAGFGEALNEWVYQVLVVLIGRELPQDVTPLFLLSLLVMMIFMSAEGVTLGIGHPTRCLYANLLGSWCINLPLSVVLGFVMKQGLMGVWWGALCGEIVKLLLIVLPLLCCLNWKDESTKARCRSLAADVTLSTAAFAVATNVQEDIAPADR
eukprot:gene8124-1452_t